MKKIFCKNCKHYKHYWEYRSYVNGPSLCDCSLCFEKVVRYNIVTGKNIEYRRKYDNKRNISIHSKNKNFDCPDYKRKWWKIWI